MEILLGALVLGTIPAFIAHSKGRSFFLWYVYGFLIFIVALIHSLVIKKNDTAFIDEGMTKCPYCAEFVKKEAKVCRYCNRDLPATMSQQIDDYSPESRKTNTDSVCPHCKAPISSDSKKCYSCMNILRH